MTTGKKGKNDKLHIIVSLEVLSSGFYYFQGGFIYKTLFL